MSSSRPKFTSRELTVMILAGLILVLAPWGWGGVVLWTVAAALGLAAAAFVATFAEARTQRAAMAAWFLGLVLALVGASNEGAAPWTYRWLDFVCFPAAAFLGSTIAAFLLSRDLTARPAAELRRELFRSVPFWAGVALFTYFVVQDLNAWGVVVDREAFWAKQGMPGIDVGKFDIRPLPYLHWLPSGLNAPFSAADTSQPPMNAWRQMMVLGAPWLLFCALHVGLHRRRGYVWLAWITVLIACAVGAFGFLNQQSNGSILGYPVPYNTTCFGTFMSRNHAGVYLYLHAALALGLTFWHIRRAGENTLKGGPHLVAAFLAFSLALLVTLTSSTGGVGIVLALFVVSLPLAYYFGFPGSRGSRQRIIIVTGVAMLLSAAAILAMVDLKPIIERFKMKAATYQKAGTDDRAPLRRATWSLISDAGWTGRAWVGYGAGSYRWISSPYQAQQKELQRDGKLFYRAIHAHNDWLEMLADWGIVGLLAVFAGLFWLGRRLVRAFHAGHPETVPLALGLLLMMAHAWVDLLFWFTPLMFTAAFVAAAMTCLTDQSSSETERSSS
ncbi:MAG: O-antigen ligase family protein [Verrucomicrobia bacterium]|nr:O-antigen ligase family protein [Verrucomicrobiota bacterium]